MAEQKYTAEEIEGIKTVFLKVWNKSLTLSWGLILSIWGLIYEIRFNEEKW